MNGSRCDCKIGVGEVDSISTSYCCATTCIGAVVSESNTLAEVAVPVASRQVGLEDEAVNSVGGLGLALNYGCLGSADGISDAVDCFLCDLNSLLEFLDGFTLSDLLQLVLDIFHALNNGVLSLVDGVIDSVDCLLMSLLNFVDRLLLKLLDRVINVVNYLLRCILEFSILLVNQVVHLVFAFLDEIKYVVYSLVDSGFDGISDVGSRLLEFSIDLLDHILNLVSCVASCLLDFVNKEVQGLEHLLSLGGFLGLMVLDCLLR